MDRAEEKEGERERERERGFTLCLHVQSTCDSVLLTYFPCQQPAASDQQPARPPVVQIFAYGRVSDALEDRALVLLLGLVRPTRVRPCA